MTVAVVVGLFASCVVSEYEEGTSWSGERGTAPMGGLGIGMALRMGLVGALASAKLGPESVEALSFAVIQWRTSTLKRTGVEG